MQIEDPVEQAIIYIYRQLREKLRDPARPEHLRASPIGRSFEVHTDSERVFMLLDVGVEKKGSPSDLGR
jgi:hypothetical protein